MWLPLSPYLPCGRTPGGPPVGACTARAPFGHGRVVRPAPSLRCLPTLPLCPRGGVRVPLPSPPTLGGAVVCGGGGGGAPLSSSLCSTHVAGTAQARRKYGVRHLAAVGGGGFLLWGPHTPEVGYLTSVSCGPMSPRPPPVRRDFGPCLLAFFPWRVGLLCSLFFFFASPPPADRLSPWRVGLSSAPPHVPSPSPRCARPFLGWVGEKRVGGGGGRPRCPSSGVSTSQARRRHEARHLSLCTGGGACRVAPVVALPTLRSHPRCPPRWGLHGACFLRARSCGPSRTLSPLPPHLRSVLGGGGGALSAPPYLHPPPLGGRRCVGGGALSSSLRCTHVAGTTQARRRHDARHLFLCRGGGGHALWLPSSPFLPCVRTPGGPPAGACTARAL